MELSILMSEKIDFKTKTVIRDKKECYIMVKGLIQQGDIIVGTQEHLKI